MRNRQVSGAFYVTAKSGFFSVASNRGELYNEDTCERRKKLPVVILSAALGMTMIPATCMAAEFNNGDTIKEQTVEDLELSSGENNTKDSQKSEIQWTGFKWDSYSQAEITLTSAVNGVCYYKWAERGEDGNPQVPQIETGNTVNDEVLISEDEEFGITLADLDTDQAVDLYIQIEDENGQLSDLKRMELDQDSRPAKKTDSEKKHKASRPKAEDSTVEGLDSPLEFQPDPKHLEDRFQGRNRPGGNF